ncbi:hypothetical protein ACN4EK_06070 [Pantanalinema rosaneae CENA516]|uniref:hypothetical protein n=1 Tax=Pantanalinema rosaneae TaxID=1620701 RepID=UPI003D6FB63B
MFFSESPNAIDHLKLKEFSPGIWKELSTIVTLVSLKVEPTSAQALANPMIS